MAAAWGKDKDGCLGLGDDMNVSKGARRLELPHEALGRPFDIRHGRRHILLLTDGGYVCSWGENQAGQLGLGDVLPRFGPNNVEGMNGHKVVQVLAIADASFALTNTGLVFAWGDNEDGALGCRPDLVTGRKQPYPLSVSVGSSVLKLEAPGLPPSLKLGGEPHFEHV